MRRPKYEAEINTAAVVAACGGGLFYVVTSDEFGRPERVVDGDTFWFEGIKIRIADIDAPEISQPQCAGERQAAIAARTGLLALLNDGPFRLIAGWRDKDRFGRNLRIVAREKLIAEGLARSWDGPRHGWCD